MYEVTRTIKGRQYRYSQRSYRENGKVRTESIYLGPVDGGIRKRKKGLIATAMDAVRDAAMIRKPWEEKPEDETRRVVEEKEAYAKRDRVNGLLSGEKITLEELGEVVDVQHSGILDSIPGGPYHSPDKETASPSDGEAEGSKDQDASDAGGEAA